MKCISCNKDVVKSIIFPCPNCNKKITRCDKCRKLSIEYKCQNCDYKGP